MRFPGDQLMISLRSLILLKENRYVSVRWEQDASNELVPVWCDEDAAEVWREMYQKSYVFNRIFNSAPSDELKPGHWVIYASIGYAVEIKAPWMMSNWRYAWTYMIFCTFHVIPRLHLHHIKREQVHWTCLIPSLPRHIYFLSRWQVIMKISSVDHLRFHLLCCLIAVTWPWNHGKVFHWLKTKINVLKNVFKTRPIVKRFSKTIENIGGVSEKNFLFEQWILKFHKV